MKAVILDKVLFQDSELRELNKVVDLTFHEDNSENREERIQRAQGHEILITDIVSIIDKEFLDACPDVKMIAQFATGVDNVDLEECKNRNIIVSNVQNYCGCTVAEFVFAMITNLTRNIQLADKHVEAGGWDYELFKGVELKGKVMGVIGTGSTGSEVVRIARGYGMKVLAHTKRPTDKKANDLSLYSFVNLQTLLTQSDFISVHVPLNKETYHLLGEAEFKMIKRGAYFINVSRGGVVDSGALLETLDSGRLKGAALDVLEEKEPIDFSKTSDTTRKLIEHPRVIVTPHIAFYSKESIELMSTECYKNIQSFVQKQEPRNRLA